MAREGEEMWVATLPKCITPSDQMVWLCIHCLDLPLEGTWQTLEDVRDHVQHRCIVPQNLVAHVSHSPKT
jgi:hypothetical protein